jgi:hypothetical protein
MTVVVTHAASWSAAGTAAEPAAECLGLVARSVIAASRSWCISSRTHLNFLSHQP